MRREAVGVLRRVGGGARGVGQGEGIFENVVVIFVVVFIFKVASSTYCTVREVLTLETLVERNTLEPFMIFDHLLLLEEKRLSY